MSAKAFLSKSIDVFLYQLEGGVEPAEESSTRTGTVPWEAGELGPSGRRRKRVKKLVSKMYMDEDGSMGKETRNNTFILPYVHAIGPRHVTIVTEKHWEDVSTDASSDGERDAGATSRHTPPSATTTSTISHGSKTATSHLASKGTKQSSLMSFFGKWFRGVAEFRGGASYCFWPERILHVCGYLHLQTLNKALFQKKPFNISVHELLLIVGDTSNTAILYYTHVQLRPVTVCITRKPNMIMEMKRTSINFSHGVAEDSRSSHVQTLGD